MEGLGAGGSGIDGRFLRFFSKGIMFFWGEVRICRKGIMLLFGKWCFSSKGIMLLATHVDDDDGFPREGTKIPGAA